MKHIRYFLTIVAISLAIMLAANFSPIFAQTSISGDVAGTVFDSSGAVIPNATITLTSTTTGEARSAVSANGGFYRIALLKPDIYRLEVSAAGFQTYSRTITVQVGQIEAGDVTLTVTGSTQTVSVVGTTPLLQTETGDIATTLDRQEIETLPNPGGDITYTAQTAPGVLMNTRATGTSGVGNFSAFGLPGLANIFTINGGNENDPFNNTALVGAFNMLIGNNEVGEMAVVNNGPAEYGELAGAQVNAISRSGTNDIHGNLSYGWNGRALNANDFFNNHNGAPRPFDNFNSWSAAGGGPIRKNKTFFFADYEGLRVIQPTSSQVIVPSPSFQALALASVPAAQVSFYKQIFAIYNAAPGISRATAVSGDTDIEQFQSTVGNFSHEYLVTGRIDHKLTARDQMFGHVRIDHGVQAVYTDPLTPAFSIYAPTPINEGQLNETHIVTAKIVNQLLLTLMHYTELLAANTAGGALFPGTLSFSSNLPLTSVGADNYITPEGRNITQYAFIDDLLATERTHSIKAGFSFRRIDTSDFNPGEEAGLPLYSSEVRSDFLSGISTTFTQAFPQRLSEPLAQYNLGFYAQDAWKIEPNLMMTGGVRIEHFSNPVCQTNCFSQFVAGTVLATQSSTSPYNQLITVGNHQGLPGYQAVSIEPRFGFSWSPIRAANSMVVRGGVGLFSSFSTPNLVGGVLTDVPVVPTFTVNEALLAPSVPGSATSVAATSNQAFTSGFSSGGSYQSISSAVSAAGGSFSAPTFTYSLPELKYPTYEEWNFGIQQPVGSKSIVEAKYVGNHGYHGIYTDGSENAYSTNAAFFTGLPTVRPSLSFGSVKQLQSEGQSNYNGLIVSARRSSSILTLQVNYVWSHALDEVSNNGLSSADSFTSITQPINPTNLSQANYGNSDYDTRQSLNLSYAVMVPHMHGWLTSAGDWVVSGSAFATSGRPFTVTDSTTISKYTKYYSGTLPAAQVTYGPIKCTGAAVNTSCLGTDPVRGATVAANTPGSLYTFATGFGSQRRNQAFGPDFFNTDLSLVKIIPLPHLRESKLQVGASFFNILNHPNFAAPNHDVNSALLGLVTATVGSPTSLLGTNLGGDASPRMIELTAQFKF